MKRFGFPVHAITAAALTGFLLFTTSAASARTPSPDGLFGSEKMIAHKVLPKRAMKGKSRGVRINRAKLRRGRFFVELPGQVSFEVVREMQHEMEDGNYAWVGHARGDKKNRTVLGVSGDAVAGTFSYRGKLFKLEPRANGEHVVSEVSPKDPAPEHDPIPVVNLTSFDSIGQGAVAAAAAGDSNGVVVDVMVAYTPAVVSIYGLDGIQAMIIQAVAETNQAYANSGMSTRLNLVKTVLTNYTTSGDMLTDLSRMRNTSDGYMDELHTLRDTYGADLVNLIDNQSGYCGLAYRMSGLSPFFASSAFSIVHHSCATGYYSFGHELGHNQGMHHDQAAAGGSSSVFPYAYGYQEPFGDFRTIMAYNCPGGCVRVNHFSNPDILFNGVPTGAEGASDNARAIDNTAATVASFRQSVTQSPPARPTNMGSQDAGVGSIELNWSDNSNDETGFHLERALEDGAFSQVASLPANSTSFTDSQLQTGVTYSYRVRAWNSSGNSNFSPTVSHWTDLGPFVDRYPIFGAGRSTALGGTWADSGALDGQVLSLGEKQSHDYWWNQHSELEYYWLIDIQPGEKVTLHTNAVTSSLTQVFTFAYSTSFVSIDADPEAWVDMFLVSPWFPGKLEFTFPEHISGPVLVSVRDSTRVKRVVTNDSLHIDSLYIRTESPTQ